MTQNLVLEITGDCWNNPYSFKQQLAECSTHNKITIDLRSEGPSLELLGITDVINQWLAFHQRSPDTVTLTRWSNPVEWVPYGREQCSAISHFFPMSQDYWLAKPDYVDQVDQNRKLFGLLIGRLSIARACMLYQTGIQYHSHCLFSKMPSRERMPWDVDVSTFVTKDNFDFWMPRHEQMRMIRWYDSSCPPSVDNLSVQDQFKTPVSYIDTNRSILNCYPRFAIEIVSETYCQGQTFFPTEKTVRPLMALKPILVYGPRYFLARLRSMGFKTWHHLWNESYDLLEGPERWQQIKQTMNELISSGQQHQIEILQQAREICKHNRQVLVQLVSKSRTLEPWMTEHDNS